MLRIGMLVALLAAGVGFSAWAPPGPTAAAYWEQVLFELHQWRQWQDTASTAPLTLRPASPQAAPLRRVLVPLGESPTYFAYTLCNSYCAFREQLGVPYNSAAEPPLRYPLHHAPLLQAAGLAPLVRQQRLGWGQGFEFSDRPSRQTASRQTLAYYSPQALQQLFDRLYLPPTASVAGVPARRVYDAVFRDYARGVAQVWAAALANGPALKALAQRYEAEAFAADTVLFDGFNFARDHAPSLLGPQLASDIEKHRQLLNQPATTTQASVPLLLADRLVGILLRRQMDGSLPTVLACFKRVLKDYDPEAYAQYGPRLLAP